MSYMNLISLKVQITQCHKASFEQVMTIVSGANENCIVQIFTGKCNAHHPNGETYLDTRAAFFLGRSTQITLNAVDGAPCEYALLRYREAEEGLDLKKLCIDVPIVDVFYAKKGRYCALMDSEYIYVTFSEMCYEFRNALPGHEEALRFSLGALLVKVARSYHAHHGASGVGYMTEAKKYMLRHYQNPLTVEKIARHVGISRSYLEALFAKYTSRGIVDYLQAVRCERAAFLLGTTHFSIIEIALDSGFSNRQHFARVFRKVYGMSPKDYRQGKLVEFSRVERA